MKTKQLLILLLLLLFSSFALPAHAQTEITVSGTVFEMDTGLPLPGVNITVKGYTDRGTTTDINGRYSLRAESHEILVFSYVGFLTQEIPVDGRETINIEMRDDVLALEELIVIGYGVQQRGDQTGSVSVVSSRDFNQGAITSPEELFQGRTAGVQVTSNSGAPGDGATIRIRGGSSLAASNDPLIVVDGVPLDDGGIAGMRNPLNAINPNDIESITVLKDASAAAIYGSRASNGVIIITTKRGTPGQALAVNYTGKYSYQTNRNRIDVLSAEEFAQVIEEQFGESGTRYLGNESTDWQDAIFRDAFTQDHNLSFTGSYGNTPYRFSVGFSGNQGVLKSSDNNRLSGTLSVTPTFFDDQLRVGISLQGMQERNSFANLGAIGSAVRFDPTKPIRVGSENDPYGGYYTWTDGAGRPIPIAPANPVALLEQTTDRSTVYRAIGNLKFDYTPEYLPDLTATLNLGVDYSDVGNGEFRVTDQAAFEDAGNVRGVIRDYDQRRENELLDLYFNYSAPVSGISSTLDLTAGYSWEHHYERGSTYASNYNTNEVVVVNTDSDYATEYYIVSFFGRANYALLDKYLFTATLRQDGTSRFSEDNRWGLFPSFAFAWKMHEERFLSNADFLSELKLRLGYGVTGQQRIGQGNYPYLPRYTFSQNTSRYPFGDEFITTLRPEGYNANLKWEETTTYNIGLDYSINNEQVFGSIELFYRETKDLLNVIPVPAGTNFTNRILSNVGNLDVKGVEFDITGRLLSTANTFWQVNFNATYTTDEITKLTTVDDPGYIGVETGGISGGVGNTVQVHSVGHPRNSFYLFEQVYDQNGMPIEGLYVDRNGDGVINEADKYRTKTPNPDFTFGLSSRFEYKNWDASFAARASFGNYVYNNVASSEGFYSDMLYTQYIRNAPRFVLDSNFQNAQFHSDFYLENAAFLRMDNISIGRTFTSPFDDLVSSIRLSATIQNVFVITEYSGQDPEVFGGIDHNRYPRPRTFMLGLNLNFN